MSTIISITPNQSIQNLKDALDRATEIVRSTTPSKIYNSKLNLDNMQKCEVAFEDLYETKCNGNQEIEVIEKSTSGNESFLGIDEVKSIKANNEAATRHEEIFNQAFLNGQTSFNSTRTSIESKTPARNQQSMKSEEMGQSNIPFTDRITPQKTKADDIEYVNVRTMNSVVTKDSPRRRSLPSKLNNLTMVYTPKTILSKKVS